MDYQDFPRNRELLSDTSTREQFLIELLDLVKEHHQVALSSLKYREGLAMVEVELKLRHTIAILENIYDKYEVEYGGAFSFYRAEVESVSTSLISNVDRQRLTGNTNEPPVDDATGQS